MKDLILRFDNNIEQFAVDERGSAYIDYLHKKLRQAEELAKVVEALNPKCLEIGAGYLAHMQELARTIR